MSATTFTDTHVLKRNGFWSLVLAVSMVAPGLSYSSVTDPTATVDRYVHEWLDLMNRDDVSPASTVAPYAALLGRLFDFDEVASGIMGGRWNGLSEQERADFVDALSSSLARKTLAYLTNVGDTPPSLDLVDNEQESDHATLNYAVNQGREEKQLAIRLEVSESGEWKATELVFDGRSIRDHYGDMVDDLLDDYSFPYLVAKLGDRRFIVLEDFERSTVGDFPTGWTWQPKDERKDRPYRVAEEDGNRYLAARDSGQSVVIGRDIKWNLKEYRYVSFRWRVHEIPEGADERYDSKVDSGAGLYFIYRRKFGVIPESVKYVWSSTLPIGSAMQRKGIGKPWMVVANSGTAQLGEWRTYVFNLYEAYERTFGHKPPDKPLGIAILSDANSMSGHAFADYDDIRALRQADVDSGVHEILETYKR